MNYPNKRPDESWDEYQDRIDEWDDSYREHIIDRELNHLMEIQQQEQQNDPQQSKP